MNVLSAETVQAIFAKLGLPFAFTPEELADYCTTSIVELPARTMAFPTPSRNQGLNISQLRQQLGVDPRHPPSFFDHPWYLDEEFTRIDCSPGWHLIRMDVLEETIEQPYNYYHSLEAKGMTLPTAVEVVLMLFLHYVKTGENLLLKKHTWCSDRASMGRAVTVGAFGRNGVFISGHPENFASRGLGVCGKIIR